MLSIHKVQEYIYNKLHPSKDGDPVEGIGSNINIYCADQVRRMSVVFMVSVDLANPSILNAPSL